MISAWCPERQSDLNSNKRGCGTPAQAQASARVDVPTAPFSFAVRNKESNTCASFCADAWMRACQATDRKLERVSAVKKVNAWTCALLTTDRDLECSSTMKKVNAWICAPPSTDHDPASVIPDMKRNSVTNDFF